MLGRPRGRSTEWCACRQRRRVVGRMSGRCSICAHPSVEAIDADLLGGASIRSTAARWAVPRSSLGRHAGHTAVASTGAASAAGPDQLSEALALLERAKTERERLRALESVRQAMRLELKDHRRSRAALKDPSDTQLADLERNVAESWQAFEAVRDRQDLAERALGGVRSAIDALRTASARRMDRPIHVRISVMGQSPDGTGYDVDAGDIPELQALDDDVRAAATSVLIELSLAEPGLTVFDGAGAVLYHRNPTPPERPNIRPHVASELLNDGGPNGDGKEMARHD